MRFINFESWWSWMTDPKTNPDPKGSNSGNIPVLENGGITVPDYKVVIVGSTDSTGTVSSTNSSTNDTIYLPTTTTNRTSQIPVFTSPNGSSNYFLFGASLVGVMIILKLLNRQNG